MDEPTPPKRKKNQSAETPSFEYSSMKVVSGPSSEDEWISAIKSGNLITIGEWIAHNPDYLRLVLQIARSYSHGYRHER